MLESLRVPRSFKPFEEPATSVQLHIFCDASEKGFGAVAYLRTKGLKGVHVGFVAAKAHVSPLKPLTIPKLELQGAVVALRLATTLQQEIRIKIYETILWTDSTCVLSWINSKRFRFKPFVENRIVEILEGSQPSQWRHVSGKENPADYASRGLHPTELTTQHPWLNGPAFLRHGEDEWPRSLPMSGELEYETEVRKSSLRVVSTIPVSSPIDSVADSLLKRTNNLRFAARVLAGVRRWIRSRRANDEDISSKKYRTPWIQTSESRESMKLFMKHAQLSQFAIEIKLLSVGQPVASNSKLIRIAPLIDEDGILRVGGRIERGPFDRDRKHPIILPNSTLCDLIITDIHTNLAHSSTERTLAEFRNHY